MKNRTELPIIITETIRNNPHLISGLAQKAFQLANYDMTPDDPINTAIRQGLIVVERPLPLMKIKRMPGNGSFA